MRFNLSDETAVEALLMVAGKIADMYMSSASADFVRIASQSDLSSAYTQLPVGHPWKDISIREPAASHETLQGDAVLANTILRMRDSMLHYEFQSAIADGDIGRAMNIMSVRLPIYIFHRISTHTFRTEYRFGLSPFAVAGRVNTPTSSSRRHATLSLSTPSL